VAQSLEKPLFVVFAFLGSRTPLRMSRPHDRGRDGIVSQVVLAMGFVELVYVGVDDAFSLGEDCSLPLA
jgi:hypothetical protein